MQKAQKKVHSLQEYLQLEATSKEKHEKFR